VDPTAERGRIVEALAQAVRRAGLSLGAASEALGHHPDHLSRAFSGKGPLRFEEVLQLLARIEVDAESFFERLYPLGGPAEARFEARDPDTYEAEGKRLRALLVAAREQEGTPTLGPAERAERARGLLKRRLKSAGILHPEASRALGLGQTALGQVLQGKAALNVEHLLGALAVSGASPARFFAELFGPDDDDFLPKVPWSTFLGTVEGLITGAFEAAEKKEEVPASGPLAPRQAPARAAAPRRPGAPERSN
jgi:transcriptional regulator with XRE-family HTH domain